MLQLNVRFRLRMSEPPLRMDNHDTGATHLGQRRLVLPILRLDLPLQPLLFGRLVPEIVLQIEHSSLHRFVVVTTAQYVSANDFMQCDLVADSPLRSQLVLQDPVLVVQLLVLAFELVHLGPDDHRTRRIRLAQVIVNQRLSIWCELESRRKPTEILFILSPLIFLLLPPMPSP
jgi:hypothetical protein